MFLTAASSESYNSVISTVADKSRKYLIDDRKSVREIVTVNENMNKKFYELTQRL